MCCRDREVRPAVLSPRTPRHQHGPTATRHRTVRIISVRHKCLYSGSLAHGDRPEVVSTRANDSHTALPQGRDTRPHGPGQRPGESHKDFFARREKLRDIWTKRANEDQLAAYKRRLRRASSAARPNRPTKVYLWKLAGDHDGDLPEDLYSLELRVPVASRSVGEMWPIYPKSHKIYDAYMDEWDICPALAPEDDLDYEELYDDYSDLPETISQPGGAIEKSAFYETELRLFYGDGEQSGYQPPFEAFRAVLRFRYGLIPEVVEAAGIEYDKYSDVRIRKYFGLVREDMDEDALSMIRPASGFVDQMLQNPGDPWAPGIIWDLEPTSDHFLLNTVQETSMQFHTSYIDNARHNEIRYTSDPQDIWWSLFVDDTTALELYRRRGIVRLQDAVYYLVQHGVRITLAWQPGPRDRTGVQLDDWPAIYLGWRRFGFQPDGWDYKEYERRARELLSQPRGRSAILRGGIIWRLAVELLGEDCLGEAALGPSADVWRHGHEISVSRGDPWYEDTLSSYELDVICGVYKVYTSAYNVCSACYCR